MTELTSAEQLARAATCHKAVEEYGHPRIRRDKLRVKIFCPFCKRPTDEADYAMFGFGPDEQQPQHEERVGQLIISKASGKCWHIYVCPDCATHLEGT